MMVHNAGYSFSVSDYGASGVDVFFVISGFVMVYTSHGTFGQPNAAMSFFRRRVIRIVPLYWFYTTLLILLLVLLPQLFSNVRFEWRVALSSYLFLLSRNNVGDVGTVLQTGWTLCFEIYFYVLFAMLLTLPQKLFLPIGGAIFIVGILVGELSGPLPAWATVTTNPILLEFYLGAAIAFLYLNGLRLPPFVALVAIVSGVSVIFFTNGIDLGAWTTTICRGLPGGAIVAGAVSLEYSGLKVPSLLVSLGNSSYSLYLVHPFVLHPIGKIWQVLHLGDTMLPAVLFISGFCIATLVGLVSYRAIEQPMVRWVSSRWKTPVSH